MTEQEIRDGAPIGATHYTSSGNYFKVTRLGGVMKKYIFRDGEYIYCGKHHKLKPL